MNVLVTSKNKEDPNKNEGARVATTLIRAVAGQRSSPDLCFATKLIKIYDQ